MYTTWIVLDDHSHPVFSRVALGLERCSFSEQHQRVAKIAASTSSNAFSKSFPFPFTRCNRPALFPSSSCFSANALGKACERRWKVFPALTQYGDNICTACLPFASESKFCPRTSGRRPGSLLIPYCCQSEAKVDVLSTAMAQVG